MSQKWDSLTTTKWLKWSKCVLFCSTYLDESFGTKIMVLVHCDQILWIFTIWRPRIWDIPDLRTFHQNLPTFKGFLATLGHWRGSKGAHATPIQTYLWKNRFKSIGLGSVAYLVVKKETRRAPRARESINPQIISGNFLEVLPIDLS